MAKVATIGDNFDLQPYIYPETARTIAVHLEPGEYQAGQLLAEYSGTAANEVQTLTASGTVSGGTYSLALTVNGETIALVTNAAYNASVSTLQTAIDNVLDARGLGEKITVGGGAFPGTALTFTFSGRFAGRTMPLIAVDASSLTGTTPGAAVTRTTTGNPGEGVFGKYTSGASNGLQNAKGILQQTVSVSFDRVVTMGQPPFGLSASNQVDSPMFVTGYFASDEIIGGIATALTSLQGRIIIGDAATRFVFKF